MNAATPLFSIIRMVICHGKTVSTRASRIFCSDDDGDDNNDDDEHWQINGKIIPENPTNNPVVWLFINDLRVCLNINVCVLYGVHT